MKVIPAPDGKNKVFSPVFRIALCINDVYLNGQLMVRKEDYIIREYRGGDDIEFIKPPKARDKITVSVRG